MKKFITIVILSMYLSGCSLFIKPGPTITDKPVSIDARAYEECEKLRSLEDPDKLLEHNIYLIQTYSSCSKKQSTSIKIIKDFANYKDTQR